jgi:hypothetical protein
MVPKMIGVFYKNTHMKKVVNEQEQKGKKNLHHIFEDFSNKVTSAAGSTFAFITALSLVLIWAVTGPSFIFRKPGRWSSIQEQPSSLFLWFF